MTLPEAWNANGMGFRTGQCPFKRCGGRIPPVLEVAGTMDVWDGDEPRLAARMVTTVLTMDVWDGASLQNKTGTWTNHVPVEL